MKKTHQFNSPPHFQQKKSQTPLIRHTYKTENGKSVKNTEIGKYQYNSTDILGKGYTGSVFKATLITDPRQKFAIKVVDIKKFSKTDSINLIERQIEIHQKLKHPNIINCLDIYKAEDHYFIVTEYCPHGDLQELMKMQKVLHEDVSLKIMKQVIEGYKFLMSKNIIHRDMKPANIMRFGSVWKIGDFGFATYCNEDFVLDKINVGTPLYMPPQSLFYNKYSYKTDIFSIGIIFYEMLTGKTPWPSRTEKQLIKTMSNEQMQIPDIIEDESIRDFLFKTCHIDYYSRMNKEEFKKFSFEETEERLTKLERKKSNTKSLKKMILMTPRNIQSSKNIAQKQFFGRSEKLVRFEKGAEEDKVKTVKNNIEKIKNEDQFGDLIYYIIQNIKYLKLDKKSNDHLFILLYQFLIKYEKMLSNTRQNALKLKCWEETKKNSNFQKQEQNLTKKVTQYHSNYLLATKLLLAEDIKHINRLFPILSTEGILTLTFYENFFPFFKEFLKEKFLKVRKEEVKLIVPMQLNVLKALKKFYIIIRWKAKNRKHLDEDGEIEKEEEEYDINNEVAYRKGLQNLAKLIDE